MASHILGIDLGSYSVKVMVAAAGFRQLAFREFVERTIPDGEGTHEERALAILVEILRAKGWEHDFLYTSLPGDRVSMRVLDFGFAGIKRADLEKAVGGELEAELPHDLEDIVYDFEPLRRDEHHARAHDPTSTEPVREVHAGTKVLAAAAVSADVSERLALFARAGLEQPRAVIAAATAYASVVAQISAVRAASAGAVLVVDHGHEHTNLCVVHQSRAAYARTLSRGGRHVTEAIAKAWSLPFADAERAKHTDGFVASANNPPPSTAWARISEVVSKTLAPLVREVRQTLVACRAHTGVIPELVLVCGGGSRLRGFVELFEEHLGLRVATVSVDDAPGLLGDAVAAGSGAADTALLAHGLVLEGATGRPLFNLRQGALAYRADFSFLRARAGFFAAAALVLIALAAVNAYAALYKLRKESDALATQLKRETMALFGKPTSAEEVQEMLAPKEIKSPLPKLTAYDQLVEISRVLPPSEQLKLDVTELDIRPQKVTFARATTDSSKSIDELEKGLKKIECFTEGMQRGKVRGATEKEFELTITTKCM